MTDLTQHATLLTLLCDDLECDIKIHVVLLQVNAGPLAYAEAFLAEDKPNKYRKDKVTILQDTFRYKDSHLCISYTSQECRSDM